MTALPALAGLLGGAVVGSYLATVCIRWPQGRQAAWGRSRCDGCGRVLGPLDLVPILSWLAARGRCRECGARIAPLHLALEVAAALLAGTALLLQPNVQGLALAAFWLQLLLLGALDTRHFWLPDRLTLLLAASGLLLGGLATGAPLDARLIGGVSGFAALGAIAWAYRRVRGRKGLGAGDPKLLGAVGLWTGWQALPVVLLLASLLGLSVALATRLRLSARLPLGALLAAAAVLWTGLASLLQR